MAEKECGCTVSAEWTDTGKPPGGVVAGFRAAINYCPKHAAVDDLIAALEPILAYYDDGVGSANTMRESHLPRARAAIRKADNAGQS